jgi:hypothetical protein
MQPEMTTQQKREKYQEAGYDDFCEAHQIPYNDECPDCSDIEQRQLAHDTGMSQADFDRQRQPTPEREKILRWVKASERLPKYPGDPQNHYRLDGEHKVHGNFHYSIDDERCEGEIVFTVIGMGLFADYVITREKFNAIEFLEEVEAPLYSNQDTLRYKNALSHIRSYSLESPCSSRIINNIANAALTNSPAPAASPDPFNDWIENEIKGCQEKEKMCEEPGPGYWEGRADSLDFAQQKYNTLLSSRVSVIEPGEQKSEIPEEIEDWIEREGEVIFDKSTNCTQYGYNLATALYRKLMEGMPQTENPMASYWFEKARLCLVDRNDFRAQLLRADGQLFSARQLILDIKLGNIYQEPADECDKWLNNNPEIK